MTLNYIFPKVCFKFQTPQNIIKLQRSTWYTYANFFQDALACYSSLGRDDRKALDLKSGMLRCYLEMDQPSTAAFLLRDFMREHPQKQADLMKYQIEAAWNLSRWDVVEESSKETECKDWSTNLGKALLLAKKTDLDGELQ